MAYLKRWASKRLLNWADRIIKAHGLTAVRFEQIDGILYLADKNETLHYIVKKK